MEIYSCHARQVRSPSVHPGHHFFAVQQHNESGTLEWCSRISRHTCQPSIFGIMTLQNIHQRHCLSLYPKNIRHEPVTSVTGFQPHSKSFFIEENLYQFSRILLSSSNNARIFSFPIACFLVHNHVICYRTFLCAFSIYEEICSICVFLILSFYLCVVINRKSTPAGTQDSHNIAASKSLNRSCKGSRRQPDLLMPIQSPPLTAIQPDNTWAGHIFYYQDPHKNTPKSVFLQPKSIVTILGYYIQVLTDPPYKYFHKCEKFPCPEEKCAPTSVHLQIPEPSVMHAPAASGRIHVLHFRDHCSEYYTAVMPIPVPRKKATGLKSRKLQHPIPNIKPIQ